MGTKPTCKGHKKDGSLCHNYALDNGYCRVHQDQAGPEAPAKWTRERLEAAIAEHGGPEGLDLAGEDLVGVNLRGVDLHGIVLGRRDKDWIFRGDDRKYIVAKLEEVPPEVANSEGDCRKEGDWPGASLEKTDLRRASLMGIELRHAELWRADLQGADLSEADLRGATLHGATLQGAKLVSADLRGVFLTDANLQGATLKGARLQGAYLANADCRELDLLDVADGGLSHIRFCRAKLDRTQMKLEQLKPAIGDESDGQHRRARDAYLALKQNFESLGDYEGAAWAYIQERRMERACSAPWRARRYYGVEQLGDVAEDRENGVKQERVSICDRRVWKFYLRHTWKWLVDGLEQAVCNYGEGPWRTALAMAVVLAFFALIYWLTWAVTKQVPRGECSYDDVPTRAIADVLVFSAGAFTTMDPKGLGPLPAWWVQPLMTLEALLGIGLTGLLGFVLGNRIRRS